MLHVQEEEGNESSCIIPSSTTVPHYLLGPLTSSAESVKTEGDGQDKTVVDRSSSGNQKRSHNDAAAQCSVSVVPSTSPNKKRAASPFYMKNLTLSAYRRPEAAIRLTDSSFKRITDDYRWSGGRVLGRGASSVVRSAIHKVDGTEVAVKCIPKHELLRMHQKRRCDEEFRILEQISHPNIVKLRDVYETSTDLYLVMDLAEEGDLYTKIEEAGRFTECVTKKIVYKMLEALRYLHEELHIVHRDVKPENILCFDSCDYTNVKLTDFGLAKRLVVPNGTHFPNEEVTFNRGRAYSRVGSDFYTAPEVSAGCGYDTAVDLYSLGVCTYILLVGSPPGVTSTTAFTEDSCELSRDAQDFISKLLSWDPTDRPTAAQALHHEWFRHSDWRTSLGNTMKETLCAVVPTVPLQVKI